MYKTKMYKTKKTTKMKENNNKMKEDNKMKKDKMRKRLIGIVAPLLTVALVAVGYLAVAGAGEPLEQRPEPNEDEVRNVIFFHPDGYGLSHWNALRVWLVGPDDRLNWDRLPYMAPYTEHMKDALTASSHGGATVHAYGVKVARDSFGLDEHEVITALSGEQMSIVEEAIQAGFATALIGSGCITEPGTAAFVASVEERGMREEIAKQVIESGADVILSGGERWLLPEGVIGRHGEGRRTDGLNLIERAEALGYTVVYTRDELMAVADTATKVLGVFASGHTFNCEPEEVLRAEGLPHYWPWAPTIAEMSAAALEILSRNPKAAEKGIFIVAEEEGTDNFPNDANAMGSFIAGERADAAFGVFADFVEENPNTLLITAGDSAAGGKHLLRQPGVEKVGEARINTGPDGEWVKAPLLDGIDGPGTAPFLSAPDRKGNQWQFAVAWATPHDLSAGIVARAKGLNANLVTELGVVDNTDIYRIMYYTLFGEWLGEDYEEHEDTVFPVTNRVARIVDGDSIILETPVIVDGQEITEVRLLGIDAPETFSEDPSHNQIVHGQRATDYLASLIPVGTEITLYTDRRKLDGLGRLLANINIKRGDLDVNAEMLRQGHAVSYVVWPNSYYDRRFEVLRSAMVEAMQNERGIWNPADPLEEIPLKYRKRKFGWAPEQYIGNFDTKEYVKFQDMSVVPIENRVYFFSYDAVIAAGYTRAVSGNTTLRLGTLNQGGNEETIYTSMSASLHQLETIDDAFVK
ncbi:alkaline phosphatase [Peptococcaceae bacterium]|nr:alkaline phosphatase [Peptococcaceae bacterium]